MKVEKLSKNGQKGQNCYPLSPCGGGGGGTCRGSVRWRMGNSNRPSHVPCPNGHRDTGKSVPLIAEGKV